MGAEFDAEAETQRRSNSEGFPQFTVRSSYNGHPLVVFPHIIVDNAIANIDVCFRFCCVKAARLFRPILHRLNETK